MALVSEVRSSLNPNAPLFIPAAVRQVEDFSPEWWNLVTTATWFRDYWISENNGEDIFEELNDNENDVVGLLPDTVDVGVDEDILNMEEQFEEFLQSSEPHDYFGSKATKGITENGVGKNAGALVKTLSMPKERGMMREAAKNWEKWEKLVKIMSPRCSPRFIQQPR